MKDNARRRWLSTLTIALFLPSVSSASIKLSFYGANFISVDGETFRYPNYPLIESDLVRAEGKVTLKLRKAITFGFDPLVAGANWTSNDKLAGSRNRIDRLELKATNQPEIAEMLAAISELAPDDVFQFPADFRDILYPKDTNQLSQSTNVPASTTKMDPRMFRLDHYIVTVDALGMDYNVTSVVDGVLVNAHLRAVITEITHSSGMTELGTSLNTDIAGVARLLRRSLVRNFKVSGLAMTVDAEFENRLLKFREDKKRFGFTNPDPIFDGAKTKLSCIEELTVRKIDVG